MNSTCSNICKESNKTFSHVTLHLDIQRPCEVNSCNPKGFLEYHPVCGKWGFDLVTVMGFSHFARTTSLQHLLYGLTCTQNPKFFSQFGWKDTQSQAMKACVRLPNQQVNKVVLAIEQVGVTLVSQTSAHCKRPPSRKSPSSRNGLYRVSFDSLGRSAFF